MLKIPTSLQVDSRQVDSSESDSNASTTPAPFPPLETATPDGLLAVGGDLSEARLLAAYRHGIFPWYSASEPILWWSPDPRCVIFPNKFKQARSLQKSIRHGGFTFTLDTAFAQVITECASPRNHAGGTWITTEMMRAYVGLHRAGIAHSVEVWQRDQLVGGLYGLALGGAFFGESMFSRVTDASKAALAILIEHLLQWEFDLIDCQVSSPHLLSLGAEEIPRSEFMQHLESALHRRGKSGGWLVEEMSRKHE